MGEPISGAWARKYQTEVPYTDARKWGTGVNAIHAYRGDPGRPYASKLDANDLDQRTIAEFAVSEDFIESGAPWGYQAEDIAGLDVFADPNLALHGVPYSGQGWPEWEGGVQTGQSTPVNRGEIPAYTSRPWGLPQAAYSMLRSIRGGAHDVDRWVSNQVPTETVSEGWVNKPASGMHMGEVPDDNVLPSAVAQYERRTSMQQRHQVLDNDRAVLRGSDESRTSIPSRIAPMKLKVYSGGERHYDMTPYQADVIPRPFTYRTAGTGPAGYLRVNDQRSRIAIQRTPPPDPSLGMPDTEIETTGDYGYESEDTGYY